VLCDNAGKHHMKTRSFPIIFLSIVLLSTNFNVCAQETTAASSSRMTPSFGFKGGLNFANLYVSDVSDENMRIGFQAGLFAKAPITRNFSIQPEFIYSQKGATVTYDNIFAEGEVSFNLHYIEIPVMAVINIGPNFNIHGGPYVAYLAGVGVKNKSTNSSFNFEEEFDRDNFETIDYGLAAGIGFDFAKAGLGLRYNYGLNEIGRERTVFGQTYRVSDAKNAVVQLYLTIGF
jgi:hypothetical protein